jgi:hypothetical protein
MVQPPGLIEPVLEPEKEEVVPLVPPVVPPPVELANAPVDDADVAPAEELAFPEDEAALLAAPVDEPVLPWMPI